MKAVVYMATRGWYEKVIPSIKSLLLKSDIDKIYLLIEDDTFPYDLPKIHPINVSKQTFIKPESPNLRGTRWGYIVMMRACLHHLIPEDVVLSIDADTLIFDDISPIFDYPIKNYYVAGVKEPKKSSGGPWEKQPLYINAGVLLMNLKKLREGKGDEIIKALNERYFEFIEQDCINELCQGKILELPPIYNSCPWTQATINPVIYHMAAYPAWFGDSIVQRYLRLKL